MSTPQLSPSDRTFIREFLLKHFSLDELKGLAFDMDVGYERFKHSDTTEFTLQFFLDAERNEKVAILLDRMIQLRSSVAGVKTLRSIRANFGISQAAMEANERSAVAPPNETPTRVESPIPASNNPPPGLHTATAPESSNAGHKANQRRQKPISVAGNNLMAFLVLATMVIAILYLFSGQGSFPPSATTNQPTLNHTQEATPKVIVGQTVIPTLSVTIAPICRAWATQPIDVGVSLIVSGTMLLPGDTRSPTKRGQPRQPVTITTFLLDKYEVTYLQYREFVKTHPHRTPEEWNDPNFLLGKDYLPVTHVTWEDATDYCRSLGKRLPSADEWELACRGGTEHRLFPWGDTWDSCRANTQPTGNNAVWPVGSYSFADALLASGDSPFGISDMAGNVAEWTSTSYNNTDRIVRGGSWTDMPNNASCVDFSHAPEQEISFEEIGFRCASDSAKTP